MPRCADLWLLKVGGCRIWRKAACLNAAPGLVPGVADTQGAEQAAAVALQQQLQVAAGFPCRWRAVLIPHHIFVLDVAARSAQLACWQTLW